MREKTIEQKLARAAKLRGGIALKFVSPHFSGMPDRIVLLPGGICAWIELKASGKKLRPLQEARQRLLKRLGFKAYVIDGMEQIEEVLNDINGGGDAA